MTQTTSQTRRWQGLADYPKEGEADNFYSGMAIDYRNDPNSITLLPGTIKESGILVTDFVKWGDTAPGDLSVYTYGDSGNLYKRTTAGSWSLITQLPNSHGNGESYFYGDDYLYLTSDSTISRYGPVSNSPRMTVDFLKAQGGIPLNTASLLLASASSMYASAADSASLSVTGDLTLETYFKMNSLPAVGSSMTLLGKWDESANTRSYKMDIYGVSGYFGSGADGSLTVSVNTTDAPIDSACTGTAGAFSLTATNVSFAANQVILIYQAQGTGAGQWERAVVQGYTAGTITLGTALKNTYTTGAYAMVMKQYTNVTVNTGITWTAKAWNGTVGGTLAFLANGTVTLTGTVVADACGFRGGSGDAGVNNFAGSQGEGTASVGNFINAPNNNNGNGGGGGGLTTGVTATSHDGGAGGGNGTAGNIGFIQVAGSGRAAGGAVSGSNDLTTMTFGGGGGQGNSNKTQSGGAGGGNIFITAMTVTVTGGITSNGAVGGNATNGSNGGCGGGAGGSILIKAQTATLGANLLIANGASGGTGTGGCTGDGSAGGATAAGSTGGYGRIHLDYYTSYTGTTTPTLDYLQDNTLVTNTTYQARLGISNDGTAYEYLTANIASLVTGMWNRLSISWAHTTKTAQFYLNAVNFAQSVGTKTAISDNASLLYVGADKGASAVGDYFDGLINDMRIWSTVLTASQINQYNQVQLQGTEQGLNAYYTFCSIYTDKTSGANTLTPHNSPTFVADVPFPAPTTRLDIDQSYTTNGQTYTVPTSISEASTGRVTFTPLLDPQKSMDFNISAKGTGNWTLTIHDAQNKVIATMTVTNANLPTSGWYEFVWSTPWRIVINKTYHAHLTSTVADGSVVTSTTSDLSTGDFHTYYGFLVTDQAFHPIARWINKIVIGNERYLATWDGAFYNANFIALPPQTHARCFGVWREYLCIGTWQENSAGTGNIYDWPVGKIYFWDGISLTYNFSIDVAEGQVNALYGIDTDLYISAGWNGHLLVWQGGYIYASGNSQTSKVKKIPKLERGSYFEVFPQGMNVWRSLLHIGVAANSDSTTLPKGVYSWGTINKLYPESLSLDYPISTGNTGSTVRIGMVYPAGKTLLVSWQDGAAYGVDQVTYTNPPVSYGYVQGLIQDLGALWNNKSPLKVQAQFLPLNSGESVGVRYSIDRKTWTVGTPDSTLNDTEASLIVAGGRGREYQIGVDLYSTGNTSPTVIGVATLVEDLSSETQF